MSGIVAYLAIVVTGIAVIFSLVFVVKTLRLPSLENTPEEQAQARLHRQHRFNLGALYGLCAAFLAWGTFIGLVIAAAIR
jgi:hypothetical protein